MTKTSVPITVFARTTSSPAHTYQVIVPIDLAQVFKPRGPLPGVAEVRDQTGTWNRPGTSRQTWGRRAPTRAKRSWADTLGLTGGNAVPGRRRAKFIRQ